MTLNHSNFAGPFHLACVLAINMSEIVQDERAHISLVNTYTRTTSLTYRVVKARNTICKGSAKLWMFSKRFLEDVGAMKNSIFLQCLKAAAPYLAPNNNHRFFKVVADTKSPFWDQRKALQGIFLSIWWTHLLLRYFKWDNKNVIQSWGFECLVRFCNFDTSITWLSCPLITNPSFSVTEKDVIWSGEEIFPVM